MGIEGETTNAKFTTVFMWLFAIVVGVIIGSVFTPNIPFIGNKIINNLEKENISLKDSIQKNNSNLLLIKEKSKKLEADNDTLVSTLSNRDSTIKILHSEIDSTNNVITSQDSIIIKIYDEQYKDINNVPNMDISKRIEFFTDYFKARTKGNN